MKTTFLLGVTGALITGILIGLQGTLTNRTGQLIGAYRTGLWTNILGGGCGLIILGFIGLFSKQIFSAIQPPAFILLLIAGALGVFIIMGVAYSFRYTGVLAGVATLILGQLFISSIVDAIGWGGVERIPFTWQRVFGLLLMIGAVYFLLPRK